jgi:hypothetical protein
MKARRLVFSTLVSLCAVVGGLVSSAVPARALVIKPYLSQLTGFGSPDALTVDSSSEVYVVNGKYRTVERFDAADAPLAFSASGSYVEGSTLKGTPSGKFMSPDGVAVDDATGEVYVADGGLHVVDVFSSTGEYLSQLTGTPASAPVGGAFKDPAGLAFDQAAGRLYVTDPGSGVVDVFSASGQYESQFGAGVLGNQAESLAVNELTEDAYVADDNGGNRVLVFNSLGSFIPPEWLGAGTPAGRFNDDSINVGMDQATGQVYVVGSGSGGSRITGRAFGVVDEFKASSSEEYVSQLNGTPAGRFSYPQAVAVAPNGDVYVADEAYDFEHSGGDGVVDVFGTEVVVPDATTSPVSNVKVESATLNGTVDPDEVGAATCRFEWGTSESFGREAGCEPETVANGGSAVAVHAGLSGLQPDTTYYYRLRASNANGTNPGETSPVQSFTTPGPGILEESASLVTPVSATLNATIDPNGVLTTYYFEYGPSASYGTTVPVPPGAEVGSGDSGVGVDVPLQGLAVDTTYHYRAVAVSEFEGRPLTVDGPDQTFTTLPAALIEESVSDVASTSATLEAQINPLGSDTTCQFQYVAAAGFQATGYAGAVSVPCPADLGEGETRQSASVHLQDFAPGTVYHYRLVATNAHGTADGSDQTFTTQGAGTELKLPDGREWEMVSPPKKEGALIHGWVFEGGVVQAAAGGSAISYLTSNPTEADPQGNANDGQDLSLRAADGGWSTRNISPPNANQTGQSVGFGENYRMFSSDLSLAVVFPFGGFTPLSPEASAQTDYLRTDFVGGNVEDPCVSGCYKPLLTGKPGYANVPPGTYFGCEGEEFQIECAPEVTDATPDLSHIVLLANGLTPTQWTHQIEGSNDSEELYEWSAGKPPSEQLQPLYLLPASEGGYGVAVGSSERTPSPLAHQLSDDGSVFFTHGASELDRTSSEPNRDNHLYLHDVARGEAVRLDVAQGVAEPSEGDAGFLYASSDGSKVLFSDGEQLTKTPGGGVYECRVAEVAGRLACGELELTGLPNLMESYPNEGALIGGSEDASYVYYVTRRQSSESKLYVAHYDGSGWTQTLIATINGAQLGTTRVSPNGRWLAFMDSQELTGYDTQDVDEEETTENSGPTTKVHHDEEVYLYDAQTNRLVCASCNPTGARPVGAQVRDGNITGEARGDSWRAASIPEWTHFKLYGGQTDSGGPGFLSEGPGEGAVSQSRYLSDSGRLFFNSHDALVPQDVNGTWDVYEYEPPGVGDCTTSSATFSERSGGCVGLISSGTSAEESAFLDASEDGSDVFFLTTAQLAPQDHDSALDIYDAHECTALAPCPTTVTTPPPCSTGDACKPAPTPQPTLFGAPSSETFSGAGNVTPAPPAVGVKKAAKKVVKCKKGFVKMKQGKCVRKGPKKSRKAKKSSYDRRASR